MKCRRKPLMVCTERGAPVESYPQGVHSTAGSLWLTRAKDMSATRHDHWGDHPERVSGGADPRTGFQVSLSCCTNFVACSSARCRTARSQVLSFLSRLFVAYVEHGSGVEFCSHLHALLHRWPEDMTCGLVSRALLFVRLPRRRMTMWLQVRVFSESNNLRYTYEDR